MLFVQSDTFRIVLAAVYSHMFKCHAVSDVLEIGTIVPILKSTLPLNDYNNLTLDQLLWLSMAHVKLVELITIPMVNLQYIPRNMHTVFALLCFVVVIHWLIFPYPPGLLRWHCGNLTIAPVPAKQPWWIWINTSCEIIMNDYITTTKQSTTKPCAYLLGYTVDIWGRQNGYQAGKWTEWCALLNVLQILMKVVLLHINALLILLNVSMISGMKAYFTDSCLEW